MNTTSDELEQKKYEITDEILKITHGLRVGDIRQILADVLTCVLDDSKRESINA